VCDLFRKGHGNAVNVSNFQLFAVNTSIWNKIAVIASLPRN